MQQSKPLQFEGGAVDYFILIIVSVIMAYIPIFGWAFLLNFTGSWFSRLTLVNGNKVKFQAGYGEALKFIFINTLLLIITLGIYTFWFVPKSYRYVMNHMHYEGEEPAATVSPATAEAAAEPEPAAPTDEPAPAVGAPEAPSDAETEAAEAPADEAPKPPTPPIVQG